jgi:hypothetical protein
MTPGMKRRSKGELNRFLPSHSALDDIVLQSKINPVLQTNASQILDSLPRLTYAAFS